MSFDLSIFKIFLDPIDHHNYISLLIETILGMIITLTIYRITTRHERGRRNYTRQRIRNRLKVVLGITSSLCQNHNTLQLSSITEQMNTITYFVDDMAHTTELAIDTISNEESQNILGLKELFHTHYLPSFQQYGYKKEKICELVNTLSNHYRKLPKSPIMSKSKIRSFLDGVFGSTMKLSEKQKALNKELTRNLGVYVSGYVGSVAAAASAQFFGLNLYAALFLMGGFIITAIVGIHFQTKWAYERNLEIEDLKKRITDLEKSTK